MSRGLGLGLAALLLVGGLASQQPLPSCAGPEHRQFDFWVGDWVVTDSAGSRILGTNRVTREEAGCLIHEHWTGGPPGGGGGGGGGGGTGQSLNFYDRATGRWAQVWVASTGNVLRLEGQLEGTAMRLEGETRRPDGATVRNRITWTPQPDGRVRQTWQVSRDGGATWQVSFDGWYRRAG